MPPIPRSVSARRTTLRGAVAATCFAAALGTGCHQADSTDSLRDTARRVKELRRQADDCMARFERSKGVALEELECFAEKHRQTIDLYPSPGLCPDCYLNYGHGLRSLAKYYEVLVVKGRQALETASSPAEAATIRAKIRQHRETTLDYYERSTEMLEIYLQYRPGGLAYLWVSENYAALEDYDRALRYLDRFVDSWERNLTAADREEVEARRKRYQTLHERQRGERVGDG